LILKKKGDYKMLLNLQRVFKHKKRDFQNDKIQLQIARLTEDFEESIKEYNLFFEKYPKSRFRFLVRYELGYLYKLKCKVE
jgi:hypothetical protein